jgi:hypothetical protein
MFHSADPRHPSTTASTANTSPLCMLQQDSALHNAQPGLMQLPGASTADRVSRCYVTATERAVSLQTRVGCRKFVFPVGYHHKRQTTLAMPGRGKDHRHKFRPIAIHKNAQSHQHCCWRDEMTRLAFHTLFNRLQILSKHHLRQHAGAKQAARPAQPSQDYAHTAAHAPAVLNRLQARPYATPAICKHQHKHTPQQGC